MGLIDMRAHSWAVDIIKELGLQVDQFPDLVPPGQIIGYVSQAGSVESGLPVGLPIIAGAGDGQCAGLGANAIGYERTYLNLGTAVVSGAFSPDYLVNPAFRTHFSPLDGSYFLETVIRGGVSTISWFVDEFADDLRSNATPLTPEEQLEIAASKVPPGCFGLLLVPYWNSVMNPYWDTSATGIMIGWTGSHGREHFYRAILEGIAFEQRLAGDGMMKALERRFDEIVAVGGGSQSDLWCQIIANITGIPVVRSTTTEATCLGAGILAAAKVGWYPDITSAANAMTRTIERFVPQPEIAPFYERLYQEIYLPLFPTIQHLVDHLTELSHAV
jgi:xylulokinase